MGFFQFFNILVYERGVKVFWFLMAFFYKNIFTGAVHVSEPDTDDADNVAVFISDPLVTVLVRFFFQFIGQCFVRALRQVNIEVTMVPVGIRHTTGVVFTVADNECY